MKNNNKKEQLDEIEEMLEDESGEVLLDELDENLDEYNDDDTSLAVKLAVQKHMIEQNFKDAINKADTVEDKLKAFDEQNTILAEQISDKIDDFFAKIFKKGKKE